MVFYYCEFCNKNISIKADAIPVCKECGHFLYNSNVTTQERQRRERERTTYCSNCDLMIYAVPIQLAFNAIREQTQHTTNLINNPPKAPQYVKDGRYKSGYRVTKEGEQYQMMMCCYCFLALIYMGICIMTFGIALVALIPLYFYHKKQNEKKKQLLQKTQKLGESTINVLYETQKQFQYVCSRCFSGVKLDRAPKLKSEKIYRVATPQLCYCELCGSQNNSKSRFCVSCGNELSLVRSESENMDELLNKCESPIEEKFFLKARKFIKNLEPNEWIGKYRVDFMIRDKKIAIELDGHDYHKTKEQRTNDAERSRYLQKNGWRVVRFTGSEIHRDINKCISDVLDITEDK